MDLKTISLAVNQIASEKGIEPQKIIDAITDSIAAAYKKEYRKRTEIIRAKFDLKTGDLKFWQIKTAVDLTTVRILEEEPTADEQAVAPAEKRQFIENEESELPRYNPERHIFIEEARVIKPDTILGEELEFPLESHQDFGRIAAQAAKQVVLQKIREAERTSVLTEFQNKEGEIISGVIQRFEKGNVFVDLGRAIGVMFYNETIPGEHYRIGERLRFYVVAVQDDSRLPGIILSRSHPKFINKLFSLEVPEIAEGVVELKAVAREPGSRTKIAVVSHADGVDPVGSCVGQRGTRVMAVTNELGQEKIDIAEWSDNPEKFIASALSPAKTKLVEILPRREARVLVSEDQLSLAIGKGGQNVRLAAKLTGWKIDVRSQSKPDELQEGGVAAAADAADAVTAEKKDEDADMKNEIAGIKSEETSEEKKTPKKTKTKKAAKSH
ncbi:MAG: transcription termination/antitermination protein NusA [Candidatus Niyogibacteria bacterium]|nr:transcription termination/antitermination protein NusA [Candidatus Niyogibacteria bacterium]